MNSILDRISSTSDGFGGNEKGQIENIFQFVLISGELGIRTPGGFNTSTVFKTAAIDRSANSPGAKLQFFLI